MGFIGDLRHLLRTRAFRRLFAVRITSQCADGIFQVALASYVLFSPERQPDARGIAFALAAVLLPFSLLGPFVGVFLDRWNRRQILVGSNLVRTLPVLATAVIVASGGHSSLFVAVVLAFSINRFLLAGLSASLPRVVARSELVLANAVTPTSGTIAFLFGLSLATGLRGLPFGIDPDVALIVIAAAGYLSAAALALRITRSQLGPDVEAGEETRSALRDELGAVAAGLLAGLQHLRERPVAATALGVMAAHRFCYGLSTVATILLYRNYFNDPLDTDAGLAGLSIAVLVSGLGFLAAAIVTPMAISWSSTRSWVLILLVAAAVAEAFPGALYTEPALLVAAFVLGLSAQGVKICVDTLVQLHVDDAFRGRVFSLYDVVFNVAFVAAAAVGALVLPADGKAYAVVAAICLGYALTAMGYAASSAAQSHDTPEPSGAR